MRAPATDDNGPLYDYTMMPTRMRGYFSTDSLKKAEMGGPFSFTKGCPLMRVPVDTMPELTYEATPVYPKEAEKKGITGKVIIKAFIDKNGDPLKVKVGKSSGVEMLDKSAVEAAKKNKYKPAVVDGKPIGVWVSYVVNFTLDGKKEAKPKQE